MPEALSDSESNTAAVAGNRTRSTVGFSFIVAALALAAWAVYSRRHDLARGLDRIAVLDFVISWIFGLASVLATLFIWRAMLRGFGVHIPLRESSRVYFVGQLGKYIPGSVWPLLAQMELARRRNVGRKTMLAGGALALVVNLVVGAVLACLLLPFVSTAAFGRFWWLFLCVPFLILAIHPRVVFTSVNWLLRKLGREEMEEQITVRAELKAAAWGVVSWLCLGVHCYALVHALGATGGRAFAASVAAGAVAVSAGILLIPVPAGAGVREVAFVACLAPVLSTSDGLLVALVSRVVLITVDVAVAAVFGVVGRSRPSGQLRAEPL